MFKFFVCMCVWAALIAPAIAADVPDLQESTDTLIDNLVAINEPSEGLDAYASVEEFFAIDAVAQFKGGIWRSARPEPSPEMREIVRRGVNALPFLFAHLQDSRPTKLVAGSMVDIYSSEYDPRISYVRAASFEIRPDVNWQRRLIERRKLRHILHDGYRQNLRRDIADDTRLL